jgi:NADPH:quinone reductase-like Zn-dependent oxidoreductase
MKAAIVESFDRPPRFGDVDSPVPREGEALIEVHAAALSQLVRAQAAGRHYSSGTAPMIPGADGIGALADGQRVYFAFPRGSGAMAQQAVAPRANIASVPDDLDTVTAAAIANPGMSSIAALTQRAGFQRGENVLVNGAAGAAGRLAIKIARALGAGRIVASARNAETARDLLASGADDFVPLAQDPADLAARFRHEIGRGIDIVLDYLWGAPAAAFMTAATGHGSSEAGPRIRFVNIGSLAGATIPLDAGALRSSGVELLGSGLGSLSHAAIVRAVSDLFALVPSAGLSIDAQPAPLAEVERRWMEADAGRIVFVTDAGKR